MAGTKTKGTDGVLAITSGANPVAEVPCLVSWQLQSSADFNRERTRCMKSNSDGGSGTAVAWDTNTLEGKGWTAEMEYFWQAVDEGASPYLDIDQVGESVLVDLFPNDNVSGQKKYSGNGYIDAVNMPSEVSANMRITVTIVGDGALTISTIA